MSNEIEKLEAPRETVCFRLNNGVTVEIFVFPDYLRVHFSGVENSVLAKSSGQVDGLACLALSKCLDICFTPKER